MVPPSPVVLLHSSPERRDKSGPDPSRILRNRRWFAIGGAPWVWKPSAPRGKSVGITGFDILVIFCAFCINVYFSACTCYRPYLSRHGSETSRTSSNALSQCGRSRFSPQRPPAASWYHLPRWYFCILAQNGGTRAALIRVGSFGTEGGSPSEVRLGCGNPAHQEVRP